MSIPKSSWRKPPKAEKGAVIRTRPIFPAAFPAVKNHAIQRGSVRTICPRKWPNRTVKGGAWAKLLPVPTHTPPGQSSDSCVLTKSNYCRFSNTLLSSSHHCYHNNPQLRMDSNIVGCFLIEMGFLRISSKYPMDKQGNMRYNG